MPTHNGEYIPQEIWDFFEKEKGLSINQLTKAIDDKKAKLMYCDFGLVFAFIVNFDAFDLIRYYRDNSPRLSVADLLQYDAHAIRNFAIDDKKFKFHNWILKNNLKIPSVLTSESCTIISSLCQESGIEFLNRKVLTSPENERQQKLNELLRINRSSTIEQNIALELADVLVPSSEVLFKSTENRFFVYKQRITLFSRELIKAATECDQHALRQLLKNIPERFDLNSVRNERNETLLMLAAAGNRKMPHGQSHSAVKLLLESGADPLATSTDGRTALMEAANFGRSSVVHLLINSLPLDKRIPYIKQYDDTKKMSAFEYAGQLGHYITIHESITKVLNKHIEDTEASLKSAAEVRPMNLKL